MDKPVTGIKDIGIVFDSTLLVNYISNITEKEWLKWTHRQDAAGGKGKHQHTNSIQVQWVDLDLPDTKEEYIQYFSPYAENIKNILQDVFSKIEEMYCGKVYRVILIKLKENSVVYEHIDSGYSLVNHHRFHIPVITNTSCIFKCGEDIANMVPGRVYEINNQLKHSVINNDKDRIHLVLDVAPNNLF